MNQSEATKASDTELMFRRENPAAIASAAGSASGEHGGGPSGRQRLLFWLTFSGVFAFGCFLRFWHLGEQSLWCDETATLSRVSGSFTYLLNSLVAQ